MINNSCLMINLTTLVLGIVSFYVYKFYNFVILSGLLLFVFGEDNKVAFADYDTLYYYIFVI